MIINLTLRSFDRRMDVMRRAVGFVRTVNIIVRLQDG